MNRRFHRFAQYTLAAGLLAAGLVAMFPQPAQAGGTLTPRGSPQQPIQIRDHHVSVTINNGFARTEVVQTFFNPNPADLEAIYSFPVPTSASLSEVTIWSSENEIHGEVLPKKKAEQLYQEEKDKGNDAGLARKNEYKTFEFLVTPVRAQDQTKVGFVYYQPLVIDTGVGRYVYPLEDGGTDDQATAFWTTNDKVEGTLSADIELKSAVPVADVRLPGFEAAAKIDKLSDGHYTARIQMEGTNLNRDLVFYYKLQENLPGRVELIPYRADASKPGTFMMVLTPGIDLGPLTGGADYTFVLDVSGSMQGKIQTLARGVSRAIGSLRPEDRFRVITFSTGASELTRGWVPATPDAVQRVCAQVEGLQANGGTNIYDALRLAFKGLDDDRATSVVLVTDGVTNTGVVDPRQFHKLVKQYDVRLFGFLMGNSANWPLVRTVCEATGGFYAGVSNNDDITGQLVLAKSKITSECLHDAELTVRGVKVFDGTDAAMGKIYRGQQLVLFGRYEKGGQATVRLKARLTGQDKEYTTTFNFPEIDTENPEVERLWALSRVEAIECKKMAGDLPPSEADTAVEALGVQYQLVTDQTSMVVLADRAFEEHGIERRNRDRMALEHQAQAVRSSQPVRDRRVDQVQPMFNGTAPGVGGGGAGGGGGGGGALDPLSAVLVLGLVGSGLARRRR